MIFRNFIHGCSMLHSVEFVLMCALVCIQQSDAQTDFWHPSGLTNHTVLSLAVDPRGHIFAGTADSGVYCSTDAGDHWLLVNRFHDRAEALAIGQDGSILVGYDPNGMLRSTDDGTTWSTVGFPTASVRSIYVKPNGEIFTGVLDVEDSVGGLIYRSSDNGKTWKKVEDGPPHALMLSFCSQTDGEILAGSRVGKFYVDKPPPNQWFFYGGIYKSIDNGEHWFSVGLDSVAVSSIAITSHERILAGSYWYGMFRSMDGGNTWMESNSGLSSLYQRNIRSILLFPHDRIFIATLGGIFFSTDDGSSWTVENAGLTDSSVSSIAIDSLGFVYIGTDNGVFRSVRSVTSVQLSNESNPLVFSLSDNYPNPFNASTTIAFSLPYSAFVTLKVYNALGQEMTTLVAQNLTGGVHTTTWHAKGVPSGVYFYRIEANGFFETRKFVLLR